MASDLARNSTASTACGCASAHSRSFRATPCTDGVINEYIQPCEAVVNGELVEVPALEEREEFSLDGVTYEAFNTSGGLGTLCETLKGKVNVFVTVSGRRNGRLIQETYANKIYSTEIGGRITARSRLRPNPASARFWICLPAASSRPGASSVRKTLHSAHSLRTASAFTIGRRTQEKMVPELRPKRAFRPAYCF